MEVISINVKLEIGRIYECEDKETKLPGKFMVIKEVTEKEYLNREDIIEHKPLGNYYLISFD